MSAPAVRVQGLGKQYSVGVKQDATATFYDALSSALRHPFRKTGDAGAKEQAGDNGTFWALKDVSFEVQPGEVVGIIGRNGAGKSTLLKILSRITAPTEGRVEVRGRLASLLEVGTGFHPELSGRENIFLNGAILGMTRREIAKKFDEIVAFAEVEKFIDTPVKRYSSGMYVRLAFAVAAHLDSDVLVVDEVLAVGDTSFQDKCMAKMGDLSAGGRTVLFVSHNQGAVARLCTSGVVMDRGRNAYGGPVSESLQVYARISRGTSAVRQATISGALAATTKFADFTINGRSPAEATVISPAADIVLTVAGENAVALQEFRVTVCILRRGDTVLGMHDAVAPGFQPAGKWKSTFRIPSLTLAPGDYGVDIYAYCNRIGSWVLAQGVGEFNVAVEWHINYEPTHAMGQINLPTSGERVTLDDTDGGSQGNK